jgi:hypothetical protein
MPPTLAHAYVEYSGMARWLPAILFGLGACSFHSTALPGTPGTPDGVDAAATPPDAAASVDGAAGGPDDIINVRAADEFVGTADLNILGTTTIDTSALTVSTGVPAGVTFTAALQDGIGADLAILHVLRFESTADITVVGARALVIIANDVSFSGALHSDSAGGGFGAVGASGGAIEIYARTQLAVSGTITVGSAGQSVAPAIEAQSRGGDGGGDGGEIVLQAPVVSNTGRLTAAAGGSSGGGSAGGGGTPGRIVLLFRTRVDAGITSPTAETTPY